MTRYVLGRIASGVLAIWGVLTIIFALTSLTGDPALLILPEGTPEQLAELRHEMGLDRPAPVQYVDFLLKASTGDFGQSYSFQAPAMPAALDRIAATIQLIAAATLITGFIGITTGLTAALRRGSNIDRLISVAVLFGQSMPIFWTGVVLVMLFALTLHILPTSGYGTAAHLVLPALTLGLFSAADLSRVARSSMIDALSGEYVRTATAKGLHSRTIVLRHALRNALIPIVTVLGFRLTELVAGTVVVEAVFAWPGLGSLILTAVLRRDLPLIQAGVALVAIAVIFINITVDMLYASIDPRVRYA